MIGSLAFGSFSFASYRRITAARALAEHTLSITLLRYTPALTVIRSS
jgi:hypothetical protein